MELTVWELRTLVMQATVNLGGCTSKDELAKKLDRIVELAVAAREKAMEGEE